MWAKNFYQMLLDLQECLSEQYHSGAFAWADKNFDGQWSKSVDRFESAIDVSIKNNDLELFQTELKYYKSKTLDLFNLYKKFNKQAERDTYLDQLKGKQI